MTGFLNDIDTSLFLFLNSLNSPFFDGVMKVISAKLTWIPLYALVLFLLLRKFRKSWWIYTLAAILLLALTDLASVHLFKNVFERLRPCHEPALEGMVHIVNGKCGGLYGFVSSHAANTFGFATLMALVFRQKIRWFPLMLLLWAAVVSYSRIYLGVHYPGDVIAGAALGALLGWLLWLASESVTRLLARKL